MERRRIPAIAVTAVLATGLVACSAPADSDVDPDATAEDVTLTLSTWAHTEQTGVWFDTIIPEFEEANPGITVDIQQIAYADYISTVTTQAVAGAGPDIIHVPTPISSLPAWAEAGFLEPLDDFVAETDVPAEWPESQGAMEWNDTTYGVLTVDYGYTLFYNEALLAEAGVEVPTTDEELVAAAKAVTDLPGDAFGYAITDDNTANFVRDALVFTAGRGAEWIDDGEWSFASDDVVEALDVWRELGTEYSPVGTNFAAKREAFLNGNSAMMIEGPFYYSTVQATADPALVDSLKIAKAPFEVNPGDISHGFSMASDLDDDTKAAAEKFLEFVISKESLEQYATIVTSPTARPGSADALLEDPLTAPIVEAWENSAPIIDTSAQGVRADYAKFADVVGAQLHVLLQGDAPTADVLADLDEKLTNAGLTP
ncbi:MULTISPECIES: ABC transporter substrate-binding protein [unclassified Microbacterium]|uniref:ABC transporter substrate-binding protein n=1 Tax=unclassified Microbacterium TaxID=2609290 RepID=UPI001604D1A7|nr:MULTISPECIES: extracellular solute-binding protein [unclassified Microbacterium]QNA93592.1 extracellular solute-binding protein [Microbacterium sp. Se63.02b]QYM63851.1 extracellular solute-binding protein [Microbacterium sp. Se5.02b]